MSGKAYTMREMRGIVEYLTQNKAFSEIKGRKMWINFANSQETKRTWQSLKETFLKRILPDIHNPYYELTLDQILSFKEGVDFEARGKNKLEINTFSDDPIKNAENKNQNDNAKPSTSNNDSEDKTSGENNKGSQISTISSADTNVVGQCYNTAEDIQRVLESPKLNKIQSKAAEVSESINQSTKSLRDFITYSEPLTPMLQELLDDFASEEESDKDSPNKIAKGRIIDKPSDASIDAPKSETVENAIDPCPSKSTVVESSNEKKDSQQLCTEALIVNNTENVMVENGDDNVANTNTSNQVEKDVTEENVTSSKLQDSEIPVIEINDSEDPICEVTVPNPLATNKTQDILPKTNENATQNCSHATNDSVLPNNPEAFNKTPDNIQAPKQNGETEDLTDTEKDRNIESRKRSNSNNEDYPEIEKKKQRCDDEKPIKSVQDQTSSIIEINSQTDDSNNVTEKLPIMQTSKIEKTGKSNSFISNVNELNTNAQLKEEDNSKDDNGIEIINPCLQSVSLYAEQFNTSKDNDTDDNELNIAVATTHIENEKQEIPQSEKKLVLNTHSESETDHLETPDKNRKSVTCVSTKIKKDKALANMFGFSTGGVTKSRKRPSKYKKKISHQYDRISNSIDSTELTSDSDSESYISPPRGRKNKHTRKYLKPESARVVSLEEEGGLFVMSGMKIFPLIKDGKVLKNYLTYLPSSDKDEDESYWKLKYVEERKKTEDLAKLLKQYNKERVIEPTSPILQQSTLRTSAANLSKQSIQNDSIGPGQAVVKECEAEHKQDNIKLKFTLNNEEVQLEGQWSNINPALDKVMQILNSNKNKEPPPETDPKPEVINSGNSTPLVLTSVDPVVRKKIDIIENEIFKEIAERDKEETVTGEQSKDKVQTEILKEVKEKDIEEIDEKDIEEIDEKDIEEIDEKDKEEIEKKDKEESFVTTRRVRKPKSFVTPFPSPSPQSPAKKKQTPKETKIKEPLKSIKKRPSTELDDNIISDAKKKGPRTSTKVLSESPNNETRSLRTRKSNVKETTESNIVSEDNSDERYMFPSKMSTRLSTSRSEKVIQKKSKSNENVKRFLSPDNLSRNSIESTQGYQDSDMSPFIDTQFRRKKDFSLSLQKRNIHQFHRNTRRKSTSCLPRLNMSSDSNNSIFGAPVQNDTENSSLNTEVYRSESYQLLLPQPKLCKRLEIINEASPTLNLKDPINKELFISVKKNINENATKINNETMDSYQGSIEAGSSSNVSLPLSPELSIVEKLSLSKDMMCSIEDPTINETQANYIPDLESYQKYLISEVDISVPLMEQECGLEENYKDREPNNNVIDPKAGVISDSLLNKIGTVKIKENSTLLHSLDQKLQDLLLESTKKISPPTEDLQNIVNPMEVDVTTTKVTTKAIGKKRCSTPRKKYTSKKSKPPKIDPVIEEEHMELCSHGGRKSCPPNIDVRPIDRTAIDFDETFFEHTNIQTTAADTLTRKKKKDIIKVKILRPRNKKGNTETKTSSNDDHTKLSANIDSGINDTGLGRSNTMFNDSVDLIHNHSETCLQAHECVGDSVEFIENSSKSIISIDSNSMESEENVWQNVYKQFTFNEAKDMPPEIFNNDENNACFDRATCLDSPDANFDTPCETVYHSPLATENTSLITEDLSDEIPSGNSQSEEPSTKWYLLSDEESNTMGPQLPNDNFTSSGGNLKLLFPIACAVPDLSTITEMSRENDDNSRKPTLKDEDDTMHDFHSNSIFSCKNISKD